MLKQPKLNITRKDFASPLRSSMSQHLGSNLHKKRSDSQSDMYRTENIQKLTDQDGFMKVNQKNLHERESVLSHSKINKYLSESFEDADSNFNHGPNKIRAYEKSQEKDRQNRFQKMQKNMRRSSPDEDVIVEDIDSYEDRTDEIKRTQQSSKRSEYTFKAEEIFNDRSDQDSQHADKKDRAINKETIITVEKTVKIQKIEERKNDKTKNEIKNVWGDDKSISRNKDILVSQGKPIENIVGRQDSSPMPYKVQLGPVGGDTLDEESSEGEEYESDLSMENNQYFQGSHDNKKKLEGKCSHNN